jgi:outer membrane receptor protein involved in Fe transport
MRGYSKSLVMLLALFLLTVGAFAQTETGQISGTITDQNGAVVSGAKLTVTNAQTGSVRSVVSSGNGTYVISNLRPATYTVSAAMPGFKTTSNQVTVNVGGHQTFDISLSLGGGDTTVEVVAGAEGLEVNTQNSELSQVVTGHQVTELPTLTRNPYSLVATAGNVSQDPGGGNRGVGFNINGQRSASVDILLDGAENTDLFGVGVGQATPLDSIQEFRVVTGNMGPEYGRSSGGVVNLVTKSGTNNFHGTGYEFNRLSTYASNDFDSNARGVKKARFTRNQFGFSVGGPVIKNKLFFFDNTEFTRVRSQANNSALILDPAFLALTNANTQAFYSAYGNIGTATQTGVITRANVTGFTAANNPNFAALPGATPVFDIVNFTAPADSGGGAPQNSYNSVSKVDWNATDKTTVSVRYTIYSEVDFDGFNNSSPYKGYNTGITNFDNNFLLSANHVFTPNLVSTSKFLFTRFNNLQPLGTQPVSPTLYFRADTTFQLNGTAFYGPGYSATTPGSAIPFGGPQNFGELTQDLSWNKGNHSLKFGGQYLYIKDNRVFGAFEEAVQALSSSGVGKAYDRLLAGQLGLLQVAIDPQGKFPCYRQPNAAATLVTPACSVTLPVGAPRFDRANRFHDAAMYVNDSWKVKPRFTLNLGLRWEYYGVQHNNNPNFDSDFFFGTGKTLFDRIRTGQVLTSPNAPDNGLWAPRKKNFAPRLGFAWDVFGNGKTSLRGGYGISYERNFNNVTFNVIQNPPNYLVVSFQPPTDAPVINISTNNFGQFGTGVGTKPLPNGTLRAVDPNIKTAYSEFYDLALEREVVKNTTLSVAYTASRGLHLYSISSINRGDSGAVYLGDSRFGSRINQQYGNINFRGSDGDNYYNAMNVGLRSSDLFHWGINLTANYTWAHAIDDLSTTFSEGPSNSNNLGFTDPFNPGLDRGNSDYDIRHRVNVSMVWDLPFGKTGNSFVKQAFGGWTLSPAFTARGGAPFSVFDCNNTAFNVCPKAIFPSAPQLTGQTGPQLNPGVNEFNYITLPGPATLYGQYADPISGTGEFPTCTTNAVFGVSAASGCSFPSTMSRRNSFRGPGARSFDLGVFKKFKLTERFDMQFRSEFYNLFNHPTTTLIGNGLNDVSSNILPSGAPYISAQKNGRRQIQFALKLIF